MNELQRMEYLSALDVDCYMPRLVLANAPQLQQCATSFTASTAVATNPPVQDIPVSSSGGQEKSRINSTDSIKAADDVMASLGFSATATPEVKKPPAKAEVVESIDNDIDVIAAEVAPFSLSLWRISDLMIIDAREVDLPLPTDRLLLNIACSMGYAVTDIQPAEILNWPFPSISSSANDAMCARADLQAFLDGKLLNTPVASLLLMGASAAKYILPLGQEYEASLYKTVDLSELSVKAIVTNSLSELLTSPQLKASIWTAVKSQVKSTH